MTEAADSIAAARRKKARTLDAFLHSKGFVPSDIETLIRDGGAVMMKGESMVPEAELWSIIAEAAGCNPPTSRESKRMVVEELRRLCG